MSNEKQKQTVQTTGHAWDGDLQEFNNPLPNWWLWGFYATVVFAIVYWVLFPAWPVGDNYTKGMLNEITYKKSDGTSVTTHWNTRALYLQEMQAAREMQAPFLKEIKQATFAEIARDEQKSAFAYSSAKVLFAENCAGCHQTGGAGVIGMYPNLADDAWLWGGSFDDIQKTILDGRKGTMPAFAKRLSETQMEEIAEYVLSLSKHNVDSAKAGRGQAMFNGNAGCYSCHGKEGNGIKSMGSANLTDGIWTVANVPAQSDISGRRHAVMDVIRKGISRDMPGWKERLGETEIKMLTFYVHELGGGK